MRHNPIIKIAVVFALCCLNCSESMVGKGGTSETVNAHIEVIDTVVTITFDHLPDQDYAFEAYAPDYRPYYQSGFHSNTVSTTKKSLVWGAPATGEYNLLLKKDNGSSIGFLNKLAISKDSTYSLLCLLQPPQAVHGILLSKDSSAVKDAHILEINGTPYFTNSSREGTFTFNTIPLAAIHISVRHAAKRLFVPTSQYLLTAEQINSAGSLRIIIP